MSVPNQSIKPLLYSNWKSSSSWRVRIALNFKNIDHDLKTLKLAAVGGEQQSSEFLEINPMGRVPALIVNGTALIESVAILEFLEEMFPEPSLLPKDQVSRAKVRSICQLIVSGIQPLQNKSSVLSAIGNEHKQEWAVHWIKKGFEAIEKLLENTSGRYCVGDKISLADCCLVPQVFNAKEFGVSMQRFPKIMKLSGELERISAFQEAHPFNQHDCPDKLKKI
ncbi:probable maleylacetoacetate isomerase 2 [Neocloeon triangulifer]|uniref:probable maleylacetoacetate isomerase 2 n=1 Tax=Neocloeon triangulifer TaxID=2078957 RepID=UPI00286F0299|nr:probable maleylacetoacetate isomerase 2 [Neocloeon triangulifer]